MSEYLSQGVDEVPDFTAAGFTASSEVTASAATFNAALATLQGVEALAISGCVTASLSGGKICFTIPIFGKYCIPSPIPLPGSAILKACFSTCGSFIPTGAKVTIYYQNKPIYTYKIGIC